MNQKYQKNNYNRHNFETMGKIDKFSCFCKILVLYF